MFQALQVGGNIQSAAHRLNCVSGVSSAESDIHSICIKCNTLHCLQQGEIRIGIFAFCAKTNIHACSGDNQVADFRVNDRNDFSGGGGGNEQVGFIVDVVLGINRQIFNFFRDFAGEQVDNPQQTFAADKSI